MSLKQPDPAWQKLKKHKRNQMLLKERHQDSEGETEFFLGGHIVNQDQVDASSTIAPLLHVTWYPG